jgi:hypothetical protein
MNSVEERIRAATRAVDGAVREVRPLRLPPAAAPGPGSGARARRARHWRTWLAPATAAAAVLAIGIALVIVRDIPNGRVVPPSRSLTTAALPEYYVALGDPLKTQSPDPVVVGDTRTGRRLATVSPPAHYTFGGVTAAADDRTFVLDARQFPWSSTWMEVTPRTWYLLRLFPGSAHPARLTRLRIPATPDWAQVNGIALSPDGTKFAVMFQPAAMGPAPGPVTLRIYSVPTGALLRTWTGPTPAASGPGVLTFGGMLYRDSNTTLHWTAAGHSLGFIYGPQLTSDTTVRILDLTRPGHALLGDSKVVLDLKPGRGPGCGSLWLTADGRTVVCGADSRGAGRPRGASGGCAGAPEQPGFVEYSTATGKLTRVLYRHQGTCVLGMADVIWASPSGDTVVGSLEVTSLSKGSKRQVHDFFELGVFGAGEFKRLPVPLVALNPSAGTIAW